jgi:regulator of replication initiation timing
MKELFGSIVVQKKDVVYIYRGINELKKVVRIPIEENGLGAAMLAAEQEKKRHSILVKKWKDDHKEPTPEEGYWCELCGYRGKDKWLMRVHERGKKHMRFAAKMSELLTPRIGVNTKYKLNV